jgi:hypothetical protein
MESVFRAHQGVVKATYSSSVRDLYPNKISPQNRVLRPLPTKKAPLAKKFSLTFIKPFQKVESIGFARSEIKF